MENEIFIKFDCDNLIGSYESGFLFRKLLYFNFNAVSNMVFEPSMVKT